MERSNGSEDQLLPPGFRFHPTDEELILFYLRNQASSKPCPSSIISQIDIYKFDPWELPGKAEYGESEWYFFSRRDRKYPNGVRPNRATVSGYWKATGTDKAIYSKTKYVGVKKSLVFYKGKPPKGIKTSWIMHEYRLAESTKHPNRHIESMRLDDWVLCRIYKKRQVIKQYEGEVDDLPAKNAMEEAFEASDQQMLKLPRTFSINHQLGLDYFGSISISHLLDDNSFNSTDGGPANFVKFEQGEMSGELETKQNSYFINQSVFANPSSNGSYLFDP